MKFVLPLLIILAVIPSCNVMDSDSESEVKVVDCATNMYINGKPWKDYFDEDESEFSSGAMLTKYRINISKEIKYDDLDDWLRISCSRRYNNHYSESFGTTFRVPGENGIEDLVENPEKYSQERFSFTEAFTDYGVGRYSVIDTTQNQHIRITEIDFDNMLIRGEFEFTLIVDEFDREGKSVTYDQRRWPDTLHISNEEFVVEFNDRREDGRERWESDD